MDQSSRVSRLMREWLEVKRCPVSNINVSPSTITDERASTSGEYCYDLDHQSLSLLTLSSRIYVLRHGNIQGAEGTEFEGIVVHFIITFPSSYPLHPPKIQLLIIHSSFECPTSSWSLGSLFGYV